jgi:hypothetical protein
MPSKFVARICLLPAAILMFNIANAKPDTVSVIGVGDIMFGTHYPDASYLPPNGKCLQLLADVRHILRSADVTFGNLEGAFTDDITTAKDCKDPKTCYAFAMPERYGDCLADAGFTAVSLANNHSGDFREKGRAATLATLEKHGIEHAGLLSKPVAIFERKGVTFGLAAFAPNRGTCQLNDYKAAREIIAGLDSLCDIVIVSFHAGAEGAQYENVTRKREFYLNLDRGNIYEFARMAIDAGADILFGHGPHVTRAADIYKDRIIFYSLGNFITYKRFNINGPNGIAPIVKVFTAPDGKFLKAEITATYQNKITGTHIDSAARVIKRMRELTDADFPESGLLISDEGVISRRQQLTD